MLFKKKDNIYVVNLRVLFFRLANYIIKKINDAIIAKSNNLKTITQHKKVLLFEKKSASYYKKLKELMVKDHFYNDKIKFLKNFYKTIIFSLKIGFLLLKKKISRNYGEDII